MPVMCSLPGNCQATVWYLCLSLSKGDGGRSKGSATLLAEMFLLRPFFNEAECRSPLCSSVFIWYANGQNDVAGGWKLS